MNAQALAADIGTECQGYVRDAGEPGGGTIKAQQNRAAENLGYPRGHWRIREAWYGEAGSWSCWAVEELRLRYDNWKAATEREARHISTEQRKRLSSLRYALAETDPDAFGPEIAALDDAIDKLGGSYRPLDSRS